MLIYKGHLLLNTSLTRDDVTRDIDKDALLLYGWIMYDVNINFFLCGMMRHDKLCDRLYSRCA